MSAEVIENWLSFGSYTRIEQILLKPIEHKLLRGKPLSCQKGQAEAFFLIDERGDWWILKKFHNSCNLDRNYLEKIRWLLPKEDGFRCGIDRQILSAKSLKGSQGNYYNPALNNWLDGTVLMPRIKGIDWSALADEIRDGTIHLDTMQRLTLCRNLTTIVGLLEQYQCCHRDLSCGNVFIDTNTWQISLIDFDSLFHPSLPMPRATTCGTTGYTAPCAWRNGSLDPTGTWGMYADRYALTLLIAEFLLVDKNSDATGEGGIFDQDELKNRSGKGLSLIISQLGTQYPQIAGFLDQTIRSSAFTQCPSPQDWNTYYCSVPGLLVTPPSLSDVADIPGDYFAKLLAKRRPAAPLWPAPNLQEMPQPAIALPQNTESKVSKTAVSLPPDPWAKENTIAI